MNVAGWFTALSIACVAMLLLLMPEVSCAQKRRTIPRQQQLWQKYSLR